MFMDTGHVAIYEGEKKLDCREEQGISLANGSVKKDAKKLCVNNRFYGQTKAQNKRTESNKEWLLMYSK